MMSLPTSQKVSRSSYLIVSVRKSLTSSAYVKQSVFYVAVNKMYQLLSLKFVIPQYSLRVFLSLRKRIVLCDRAAAWRDGSQLQLFYIYL